MINAVGRSPRFNWLSCKWFLGAFRLHLSTEAT